MKTTDAPLLTVYSTRYHRIMRSALLLLAFSVSLRAQTTAMLGRPNRAALDSITSRGMELYRYDRAAWDASDALLAFDPKPPGGQYVVVKSGADWVVYFGKLSAASDTFFTFYVARKMPGDSAFVVERTPSAAPDVADLMHRARALATARAAFGPIKRPYNHSVIPAKNGEWLVYLYPAQTVTTRWPLGGDERFRISADGERILDRHRMHNAIVETPIGSHPDSAGRETTTYFHTAVLDDRPEDSDVFAVVSRNPRGTEVVLTENYVYMIGIDGSIQLPRERYPGATPR